LTEAYRRIRNTCRYILGNLSDFDLETGTVPYPQMEELDRWALNRLQELNEKILKAYDTFDFHLVYHNLHNFCVLDLSSFYLDIIKDRLYTSPKDSAERRSAQTAMHEILEVLVRLMAPILSFTADEVWEYMKGDTRPQSIHSDLFIPINDAYRDPELAARWEHIIAVRKEVTKALELARKEKQFGHSLDASVMLGASPHMREKLAPYEDQLRSIFIVSSVDLVDIDLMQDVPKNETMPGVKLKVFPSSDQKCERCWVHDHTVGHDRNHPTICERCVQALAGME
jgi:isoleucyl-tRNA synthetase